MEGKIIIVGATGYTGSALAKLLKKENIDCHLIGRNELELKKLATETNQSFSVCMDVSNEQSVEDSLKFTESPRGKPRTPTPKSSYPESPTAS